MAAVNHSDAATAVFSVKAEAAKQTAKERGWASWFKSDEAKIARGILKSRGGHLALPKFSETAAKELTLIISKDLKPQTVKRLSDSEIRDQLTSMTLDQLRGYVGDQREDLVISNVELQGKRSRGLRRVTTGFQEFAATFERFLKAYSGIVDLAQLADSQYGGAASAILALLFAVHVDQAVKLKARDEHSIISAMKQINDRLPEVDIYHRCYADSELGTMLATVYCDIILFAREATLYFQGHGYSRLIRSAGNAMGFQKMEENMRENFNNLRTRCEALLAERVNDLFVINEMLLTTLNLLENKMEVSQSQSDNRILIEMRQRLGLGKHKSAAERADALKEHQKMIIQVFEDEEVSEISLAEFAKSPEYKEWEGAQSSLLVLYGTNEDIDGLIGDSWLSTVAADQVFELKKKLSGSKRSVAYYFCKETDTTSDVIRSLIYQLLEERPEVLRNGSDLRDLAQYIGGLESDQEDRLDLLRKALLRIVDQFPNTVYIVIDRPESCEGKKSPRRLLRSILSIVEEAKTKVKVLAVVRHELWDANVLADDVRGKSHLVLARRDQQAIN